MLLEQQLQQATKDQASLQRRQSIPNPEQELTTVDRELASVVDSINSIRARVQEVQHLHNPAVTTHQAQSVNKLVSADSTLEQELQQAKQSLWNKNQQLDQARRELHDRTNSYLAIGREMVPFAQLAFEHEEQTAIKAVVIEALSGLAPVEIQQAGAQGKLDSMLKQLLRWRHGSFDLKSWCGTLSQVEVTDGQGRPVPRYQGGLLYRYPRRQNEHSKAYIKRVLQELQSQV